MAGVPGKGGVKGRSGPPGFFLGSSSGHKIPQCASIEGQVGAHGSTRSSRLRDQIVRADNSFSSHNARVFGIPALGKSFPRCNMDWQREEPHAFFHLSLNFVLLLMVRESLTRSSGMYQSGGGGVGGSFGGMNRPL